MPSVARIGDNAGGAISGPCSNNVFVNGRSASLLGDSVVPHPPYTKYPNPHQVGPRIVSGSGTVFVNGRPLVRIGDSVSCGHSVASGSGNVIAG